MKKTKVIESPFDDNDYLRLMRAAIALSGRAVVPIERNLLSSKVIILNWYENIVQHHKNLWLLKKILMFSLYRILGCKVVWVAHNRQPHDITNKNSMFMMKFLARFSDRIMILCDDTIPIVRGLYPYDDIQKKIYKVPMVNFTSILKSTLPQRNHKKLRMLSFGRIAPYKGLDVLIDALGEAQFSDDVELIIAGQVFDEEYAAQLKKKISAQNLHVTLIDRFISINYLQELSNSVDIFVLPLDISSALNSSSVMMAFSLAQPVLCPEIGTIHEYANYRDFCYSYSYRSRSEHRVVLSKMIDQVVLDKRNTPDKLEMMGKRALDAVHSRNSIDRVAQDVSDLFNSMGL